MCFDLQLQHKITHDELLLTGHRSSPLSSFSFSHCTLLLLALTLSPLLYVVLIQNTTRSNSVVVSLFIRLIVYCWLPDRAFPFLNSFPILSWGLKHIKQQQQKQSPLRQGSRRKVIFDTPRRKDKLNGKKNECTITQQQYQKQQEEEECD